MVMILLWSLLNLCMNKEKKMRKIIFICAVMILSVCLGCNKEDIGETTFPSVVNSTFGIEVAAEPTTKYEPKDEYSEGYEGVDEIMSEKYPEFAEELDEYFDGFQGSVLVAVGDEIILAKGYGYADDVKGIPNTMNTTFELGKVSMQFTTVAAFQLIEEGLLTFETTIDKFFPAFERGADITVEELIFNYTGIPDYTSNAAAFGTAGELEKVLKDAVKNDVPLARGFLIDYLNGVEFTSEHGTKCERSMTNYYMLAHIIEQVSGMTFEDYVKNHVLNKYGMTMSNLAYQGTTAIASSNQEFYKSYPVNLMEGVATVNSNVIELYKWNRFVIDEVYPYAKENRVVSLFFNASGFAFQGSYTYCFLAYNGINPDDDYMVIMLTNNVEEEAFFERSEMVLYSKIEGFLKDIDGN